jgi:hypothetical protein
LKSGPCHIKVIKLKLTSFELALEFCLFIGKRFELSIKIFEKL